MKNFRTNNPDEEIEQLRQTIAVLRSQIVELEERLDNCDNAYYDLLDRVDDDEY